MVINKDNLFLIKNMNIHDMELKYIEISYFDHKVDIFLKSPFGENYILQFCQVKSFLINIFEPWGEGVYLAEIEVEKASRSDFSEKIKNCDYEELVNVEVLINSGDKLRVLTQEVKFEKLES